jgi:hypothetical protein
MSKTAVTKWVCDNCGHEEETNGGIPPGWFHVVYHLLGRNDAVAHLCAAGCVTMWAHNQADLHSCR